MAEEHYAMRIVVDEAADEPSAHIEDPAVREEIKRIVNINSPKQTVDVKVSSEILLKDESPTNQLARRLAPLEKRLTRGVPQVNVQVERVKGVIVPALQRFLNNTVRRSIG